MWRLVRSVAACFVLVMPGAMAGADQWLELDLDGVLGNGPDTLEVGLGDVVEVDVWLSGGRTLMGFDLIVCNHDAVLDFQSAEYHTPGTWGDEPALETGEGCVGVATWAYAAEFLDQPVMPVTLAYWAVQDKAVAFLDVEAESSMVWYEDYSSSYITNGVGAYVRVGSVATSSSTWGMVKQLFR